MIEIESEWVLSATNLGTITAPTEGRALDSELTSLPAIPMGAANGPRFRSLIIRPYIQGSDNQTVTLTLWARRRTCKVAGAPGPVRNASGVIDGSVMKLGALVCTGSAAVGKSTGVLTASDRMCDTLVWTPETYWTNLETAFGASLVAHSPGSDKPGELIIPDLAGIEEIRISATLGTATSWNALIERQT